MPTTHSAAPELDLLLNGSSAGELIPELARHGLQHLLELKFAAFLGADWHERTEEWLGYRNGYGPCTLLGSQSGISKSQVSRICQEFDQQVQEFLARLLESSGYA